MCALLVARAGRPRALPAGKRGSHATLCIAESLLAIPSKFSSDFSNSRLLAVFTKLKDIATPISSAEEQQDLIEQATGLISDVCNDHVAASKAFVKDPQLREELVAKLKSECQELIEYIMATRRFNLEINSRAKDRVVSFGEKLSCLFMATLLKDSVRCAPKMSLHGLL